MSQVITNAFEQYWQSSLAAEQPVVLDEFVLADIPNLDITSPIDPDTGLPPAGQIVYRQDVDQRGRVNNNAVAYSIVMDTAIGDFSFNAMYLRNKANGVVGMIVYKGRETKLKTNLPTAQTGNSLVKSMLMGYDQAAEATLTQVDAGTWQIDYAARLRGQDEDLRQLASQLYGHHTFIGDGFKAVQEGATYKVTQGVAIVGGLRIELQQPEVIYPGTKPIGVWVDVYRSGSLLSEHQNHFTIITSVADLTDHVDGNGYQHYVAKLATVQADSTVVDGRGQNGRGGAGAIPDTIALWKRAMAEAGYDLIGQFGAKNTIQNAKQVLLSKDGTGVYAWLGGLPKNVPADATLENTGGLGPGLWLDVGTDTLRSQHAAPTGSVQIGFQQADAGAVPRTSLDKQREIINAADYGVIGGLPDETVNLQKAFEAALLRNGILELNPGVYNYTTLKVTANDTSKHIMLYARGKVTFNCIKTTPDISNYDADYAIKLTGFFQTEVSLTADGNINTGLLTLSSVAGINPNDLLEVKSSRLIQTDSRGNAREGQLVRVNSVNPPLSRVGLDVPLEYYAPASRVTNGAVNVATSTTQFILSGIDLPEREAMVSFRFTSGTLNGQTRFVTAWDNVTKVAKFDGDQAAWPAGAAPGDTFSLVWETKVSVIKPITARVVGDFNFTRALHTGAAPGDVGFRGLDIVYGDIPIVSGVTAKRFSETGIRFRSCFRPIIRDSIATDANRAYNVFDGTGYGVSFNQCFEGIADNVSTYRCRKGIDIIGAQHISWRTRIVNCNDSGGGVDYVGNAFWPTGPTENTGLGSHGSGYGTLYSNCQVADKFLGWGCRGLEETIQNCQHRGYGESCVRYWYGGGLTVDGFTYNDRFSEIGRDASNRYMISGDPESRCLQFMEVYTDSRSYIQTLPLTIKNVTARKLRLAFIQFFGMGTSGTMYNLTLGDNVVWASPEGGTNVEFTFVRCEDTKQMFNLNNLGGNRYSFDGTEYSTFWMINPNTDQIMPAGTLARLDDFLWTASIADDAVLKIPVGNGANMAMLTMFDRDRDRTYRVADAILGFDRAVDYSPLQATNKVGTQLSNTVLNGTTGTDGQVTLAYRPGTERYFYIENRTGAEIHPVIKLVSIQ